MPMIFCLLRQMEELPPADFLAAAQLNEAKRKAVIEKKSALGRFQTTRGPVRKRRKDGD